MFSVIIYSPTMDIGCNLRFIEGKMLQTFFHRLYFNEITSGRKVHKQKCTSKRDICFVQLVNSDMSEFINSNLHIAHVYTIYIFMCQYLKFHFPSVNKRKQIRFDPGV